MLIGLLAAGYPLVVHLAVTDGHPDWAVGYAVMLLVLIAGRCWQRNSRWLAMLVGGLSAVMVLQWYSDRALAALYWQPLLINIGLGLLFGYSLLPGQVPLITRIMRVVRGRTVPEAERYTRNVTWLWTWFFVAMTVETVLLAWLASPRLWSWFTNGINYLLAVMLFVGEYFYRRYRLADLEHQRPLDYLRSLCRPELRNLFRPGS